MCILALFEIDKIANHLKFQPKVYCFLLKICNPDAKEENVYDIKIQREKRKS